MTASSKKYQVTKWVRANVPCEHPDLAYKEAVDLQRQLTKKEGAKNYIYIYTIEESA